LIEFSNFKRSFLDFSKGIIAVSRTNRRIIEISAIREGFLFYADAKKIAEEAVSLIEERFGLTMVRYGNEWEYISWPNYYSANANFAEDVHRKLMVRVDDREPGSFLGARIRISLSEMSRERKQRERSRKSALDLL
jgi:hypothetical protein